ncbi:ABC transporter permease [Streptacidiphilus sp. MAP5-3]|uniref:ABC transporter permease n=1 Tax=unclassified Streptacidiphilus TaxID=2643834 RepID=UPI003519276E
MAGVTVPAPSTKTGPVGAGDARTPGRPQPRVLARLGRIRFGRAAVLLIAGLYFLTPMLSTLYFTVDNSPSGFSLDAYKQIFSVPGLWPALQLSLLLAAGTIVLVYLLLVPTVVAVRLGSPRLRTVVELTCTLPLVVPSIALTAGITAVLRWCNDNLMPTPFYKTFVLAQSANFPVVLLLAYVVMALPLAYRTLDAGVRALDVRTLLEAAQNNGASRARAIVTVILPNMRSSLLNTAFITLALVLGEFTVASILGYVPFAVWIVNGNSAGQGPVTVAVSIVSLLLTWLLLLVLSAGGGRRKAGANETN